MYFKRLKELREDNDKTQEDIAKILNMKRQQYQRYETGVIEIPFSYVIKLAKYYKVSIDYIAELSNKL